MTYRVTEQKTMRDMNLSVLINNCINTFQEQSKMSKREMVSYLGSSAPINETPPGLQTHLFTNQQAQHGMPMPSLIINGTSGT
jgi:hypothetical protein